mmetsp:Transcript_48017/g.108856  ORF Transcript_48017/g.108856 Transcript_48017/m.108856 type:complete len:207 (+) Transcript_48017:153-773(+)
MGPTTVHACPPPWRWPLSREHLLLKLLQDDIADAGPLIRKAFVHLGSGCGQDPRARSILAERVIEKDDPSCRGADVPEYEQLDVNDGPHGVPALGGVPDVASREEGLPLGHNGERPQHRAGRPGSDDRKLHALALHALQPSGHECDAVVAAEEDLPEDLLEGVLATTPAEVIHGRAHRVVEVDLSCLCRDVPLLAPGEEGLAVRVD